VLFVLSVPSPDGPAEWLTAIGTLAAAAIALTVAIWSWWRERKLAKKREQSTEAYSVQVVLTAQSVQLPEGEEETNGYGDPIGTKVRLVSVVVSHGAYTITDLGGAFELGDATRIESSKTEWLSGYRELPDLLREGLFDAFAHNSRVSRLAPWDTGIRILSEPMEPERAESASPVVWWTDRWGTRWEYRPESVRKVGSSRAWLHRRKTTYRPVKSLNRGGLRAGPSPRAR
jgi:hypothetical protein